jgi:response regulator RpfG family c-di-GMP phosphodiesterase
MLSEKEKLDSLAALGIELNQINDLDLLMERILFKARSFVNADAGSVYIKDEDNLLFTYTQNDTLQMRLQKGENLIYSTFSIPIDETSIAGYVAATGKALNLPDIYKIDPTKPYQFSGKIDEASQYTTKSVLTVPLKTQQKNILGVLQIINAQDDEKHVVSFSKHDEKIMFHFASVASVAIERAQMTRAILLRMIRMAEMRDPKETGAHVNRVGGYAVEIYEQWARRHNIPKEVSDKERDVLRMAAMLHDAGKVGISDVILKKPGKLESDEYDTMKQHTVLGAQLFLDRQSKFDDAAMIVALNHHERWDGNGYPGHIDIATGAPIKKHVRPDGTPAGKKGEEIPVFGRIVAIADVYDALSSVRTYKKAWDESRVLSVIEKEAGAQFDPEMVEIFFSSLNMLRSIKERYRE